MSLISGVPVRAISRGRPARARIRSDSSSTCWERWDGLVLDEVGLVDDHAAEPEVGQPADMAVEHLVVHHHDVGEPVDGVPVTVDDRDGRFGVQSPASRAQFVLTTLGTTTSRG